MRSSVVVYLPNSNIFTRFILAVLSMFFLYVGEVKYNIALFFYHTCTMFEDSKLETASWEMGKFWKYYHNFLISL